jgi:hypothetical protein
MLEGFGAEAWRRFKADEFTDEAFYCVAAQRAGLEARLRCAPPFPRILAFKRSCHQELSDATGQ